MINIAICDDNKPIVEMVYTILRRCNFNGEEVTLHKYYDTIPLAKAISGGEKYDIIFLDIKFERSGGSEDFDGIYTTGRIKNIDPLTIIICMSQYDYYKELAKVETFYFLEKPFEKDDIIRVLDMALMQIYKIRSGFEYYFMHNGVNTKVDLKEQSGDKSRLILNYF